MLTTEDKGPAGLHHWNVACVCLAVAGVRAVPPLCKPYKERQDQGNQPRIFLSNFNTDPVLSFNQFQFNQTDLVFVVL